MVPTQVDPLLLSAWQALATAMGPQAARAFFEAHVVNGTEALRAIRRWQESQGIVPPHPSADTLERMARAASTNHDTPPSTPRVAESRPPSPPQAPPPAAHPPEPPPETTSSLRPTTQVDMARHLKLLDRKWLASGFVLRLHQTGQSARRIPLNFRRVSLGTGEGVDVALPLPAGTRHLSNLRLINDRFVLEVEDDDVPLLVNGQPASGATLADGDRVKIGDVHLRVFRLLEQPAELIVVSGQGAGERFIIDTSEVRIGRYGKRDNDVLLEDPTVSREHATIRFEERKFILVHEATASPTVVNGEQVVTSRILQDQDQIVLGEQTLVFRWHGASRPRTLHSRTATVLFSDLRGWTGLAEVTPLQALITQMDTYFKAMGEIITRHGGTLMTYLGDALMAVFGAPSSHKDDPWRAVASAVEMLNRLDAMNVQWAAEGKPTLASGIGIHTGVVMVGEMGHPSRLEYSAMGDATNLAARLETLTKDYDCRVILSEATYAEVAPYVNVEPLGEVTVKGRSVPTAIYKLIGMGEVH